ncbi:hypothetical protein ACFY2H_33670 [Streptomyces griseofuscus]|uniref:hypothetical protein n=1 Tax=Streptomyces TaxID=1883 RepID=UPI000B8312F4|nr:MULTISPECIES: hypothetical protein [Streptomyces]BBC95579.1 hypothetical protein SRO_4403 [Streptomyces rochei]MBA9046255.1 hypothetical protein [Streptomyces murinus]MBJ7001583.1 hypothetical protein [Streptomyces sp. CRPSP2-6A1]MYQ93247.1 hypothetical protein [Streptomyces sp. SID4946]MYR86642.1 hypothetical protein [Streptomyces sp. SID685]
MNTSLCSALGRQNRSQFAQYQNQLSGMRSVIWVTSFHSGRESGQAGHEGGVGIGICGRLTG